ncbi:MAG: hypothetical protein ACI4U0_02555 [Candidatus Aphodocola sp.]
MNKLFLMKNSDLFQGEKYLNKNKNYFEGWYFKNINLKEGISFIPGINIDDIGKKAFIQIITNNKFYYVNYNIEDFKLLVEQLDLDPQELEMTDIIGEKITNKIFDEIKSNI